MKMLCINFNMTYTRSVCVTHFGYGHLNFVTLISFGNDQIDLPLCTQI